MSPNDHSGICEACGFDLNFEGICEECGWDAFAEPDDDAGYFELDDEIAALGEDEPE